MRRHIKSIEFYSFY